MSEIYNKLKQPPLWALRTIQAGRLKGKSDINPQWRYEAMDELFGVCGFGWWYTIDKTWLEQGANEEVTAMAQVSVYYKKDDVVSQPLVGIGGSMLVAKEKNGLYTSDEAYKMAVTDALSVALKFIGMGADIYKGLFDGSKYMKQTEPAIVEMATPEQLKELEALEVNFEQLCKAFKLSHLSELTFDMAEKAIAKKKEQK